MISDLDIYHAYPRHVAKIAALKAIAKAVHELARDVGEAQARETILRATEAFAASPAGNRGLYTPHPATWYNAGRYLDDPREWEHQYSNGGSNGINLGNRKANDAQHALERANAAIDAEERAATEDRFDVSGPGGADGRDTLAELFQSVRGVS